MKPSKQRYKFAMSEAERLCTKNNHVMYEDRFNPFLEDKGTEAQVRKFRLHWNYWRGSYLRFEDCMDAYGAGEYLVKKEKV